MNVITKSIGRLPVNLGDYTSRAYGKKNRVFLYGCEWESKVDNNTYAPATLNTTTGEITPDTTHWKLVSGSYNTWAIDNGYKSMDAGGVKDGDQTQHAINENVATQLATVDTRIATEGAKHYLKTETYTKEEVNGLVTTPNQQFVTVAATDQTTDVTDVLPTTGEADTVYRVSNWDGTQYDATVYSEYAWNGTQYIHLSTKTQIGEVFDISAYHATGGTLATYSDLNDALNGVNGGVPQSLQKGGMSVKYVDSYDNKYVQYRLMSDTFNTTEANWQGVDDEPTAGSDNLVKSGGVYEYFDNFSRQVFTNNQLANAIVKEIHIVSLPDDVTELYLNTFNRALVVGGTTYWVIGFRNDNQVIVTDQYAVLATSTLENYDIYRFSASGLVLDLVLNWNAVEINSEQKFYASAKIDLDKAKDIRFSPYIYSKTDLTKNVDCIDYGMRFTEGLSIIDHSLDGKYYDRSSNAYEPSGIGGVNSYKFNVIPNKYINYRGGSGANASAITFVMNDGTMQYNIGNNYAVTQDMLIRVPDNAKYAFASSFTDVLEIAYNNRCIFADNVVAVNFFKELYVENYPENQDLYIIKINRALVAGSNTYWVVIFGTSSTDESYHVVYTTTNQDAVTRYDVTVSGIIFHMIVDWTKVPTGENAIRTQVDLSLATNPKNSETFYKEIENKTLAEDVFGFDSELNIAVLGDSITCFNRGTTPLWDAYGGDGGYPVPQRGITGCNDMWFGKIASKINADIKWLSAYGGTAVANNVRELFLSDNARVSMNLNIGNDIHCTNGQIVTPPANPEVGDAYTILIDDAIDRTASVTFGELTLNNFDFVVYRSDENGWEKVKYKSICNKGRWGNLRIINGITGNNPDIILILAGINDFISNAPIGTYDDSSDAAQHQRTFYSAYKYLIKGLIETYPAAKVICLSPLKMYGNWFSGGSHSMPIKNSAGVLLEDYVNAIKDIASKNGAFFIDTYNNVNFTLYNNDPGTIQTPLYCPDGLHPNALGMKLIGNYAGNVLRNVAIF